MTRICPLVIGDVEGDPTPGGQSLGRAVCLSGHPEPLDVPALEGAFGVRAPPWPHETTCAWLCCRGCAPPSRGPARLPGLGPAGMSARNAASVVLVNV